MAAAAQFARAAQKNARATHSREQAMRIFARKGAGADAARIIVSEQGANVAVEDPELIRGRHNDVVIWFCENQTRGDITVELRDFRLRFRRNPPAPVDFHTPNPIPVPARSTALIYGTVNRDPRVLEFFKYTVRVTAGNRVHDHDPDLEIKP